METYVQELKGATDFVRQLFADRGIALDYSPDSVRHLDALFREEFNRGQLINDKGIFAQYQGVIMTGISGYVAQVILQNTVQGQLSFEDDDENWFINFCIEAENGWKIIPGHKVLKRAYYGEEEQLYAYVITAISYLAAPRKIVHHPFAILTHREIKKNNTEMEKKWWKLW